MLTDTLRGRMIEEETDEEEGWAKRTGQEKENCFRGDSHNGTGIVGRCYFFDSAEGRSGSDGTDGRAGKGRWFRRKRDNGQRKYLRGNAGRNL